MNVQNQINFLWLRVLLVSVAAGSVPIKAQQVIGFPVNFPEPPRMPAAGPTKPIPLSDINSAFPKTGALAQWGPVGARPHFLYQVSVGDGLLNPGQLEPQSSTIQTFSIGVLFELGKRWTLDYTLSKTMYSNPFIGDSSGQDLVLNGSVAHGDWTLGVFGTYRSGSPILVQTGRQTDEKSYVAGLNGSYRLGPRTFLESSFTWNTRLVDQADTADRWTAVDWHSWTTSTDINYQFSSRFTAGLGVTFGSDNLQMGSDMTSSQTHAKISWRPTSKISLSAQAGNEVRHIKGGGVKDLKNPVYSASLEYKPFEVTSISLSATQSVSASYFADQASKNSTLGLDVSQRLLQRLYLSAGIGQGRTNYIATSTTIVSGRNDKYTSYHGRISTTLLRRGTVGVFFHSSSNSSNTAEFDFSSHQYGAEIGYRY